MSTEKTELDYLRLQTIIKMADFLTLPEEKKEWGKMGSIQSVQKQLEKAKGLVDGSHFNFLKKV